MSINPVTGERAPDWEWTDPKTGETIQVPFAHPCEQLARAIEMVISYAELMSAPWPSDDELQWEEREWEDEDGERQAGVVCNDPALEQRYHQRRHWHTELFAEGQKAAALLRHGPLRDALLKHGVIDSNEWASDTLAKVYELRVGTGSESEQAATIKHLRIRVAKLRAIADIEAAGDNAKMKGLSEAVESAVIPTAAPPMDPVAEAIRLQTEALRGVLTAPVDLQTRTKAVASRKSTINARMIEVLLKQPDAEGWTVTKWTIELKCSRGAVVNTETWKKLKEIHAKMRAERRKDRRRR